MRNGDGRVLEFIVAGKALTVAITLFPHPSSEEWLVLLHGLQSNRQVFRTSFEDDRFLQYSIARIDLIGFGGSDKPIDFSNDLNDQADLVALLIAHMKIKKAIIVGHSLGGMIATLLLRKIPHLLMAIVSMEGNLVSGDCGDSKKSRVLRLMIFRNTMRITNLKSRSLDPIAVLSDSSI